LLPLQSEQQANEETKAKDQHGMLVQQSNAANRAKHKPEPLACAIENLQDNQSRAHPEKRLECVHGQQRIESQVNRRNSYADAGQRDAESPGT
jgi:hypothetical protein